jgi:hypothetical protein
MVVYGVDIETSAVAIVRHLKVVKQARQVCRMQWVPSGIKLMWRGERRE